MQCYSSSISKPERACANLFAPFLQNILKPLHIRRAFFYIVEDCLGARAIGVKADQRMPVVSNAHGVVE